MNIRPAPYIVREQMAMRSGRYPSEGMFDSFRRHIIVLSRAQRWLLMFRAATVAVSFSALLSLLVVRAFAQEYTYPPQQQYVAPPVESAKDSQQDEHMVAIDASLAQWQKDRAEMRARTDAANAERDKQIRENSERMAKDEGIAIGAFALISFLSTGGLVVSLKMSKKDKD